jgi:hypothetical protein
MAGAYLVASWRGAGDWGAEDWAAEDWAAGASKIAAGCDA